MIGMFWVNDSFNQDIGKWDVSKVENMMLMFSRANAFNQDIGEWDVSNVTKMREMFTRNDVFNGDIGSWDVSAVTNMTAMFKDAISFSQDLSSWCAPLISDPGSSFASGSPLEVNSGFLPNWGCNLAPVHLIAASGVSGQAPYSIDFDATGSTYANGDAMTFTWDFGDGATAEGKTVSHTYTAAGDYNVVLVVSDGIENAADSISVSIASGVATEATELPETYELRGAYPNPFNPTTTLTYGLPEASEVRITVTDLLGRQVASLLNGEFRTAGYHTVQFNADGLASGTYLIRMEAGDFVATQQVVLLK